jgi:hypothetical protein
VVEDLTSEATTSQDVPSFEFDHLNRCCLGLRAQSTDHENAA